MESEIIVRRLNENETADALSLVRKVFLEYEAPDYPEEGIEEFFKSIHDEKYLSQLRIFGAFKDEKTVGVIATRNGGTHIALFFVDGKYQRQGIGKELFKTVCKECNADIITVNSSPFAVPIYQKLGFCKTDEEQTVNGLRFTPMEYKVI
ncbi:MAG: GNAT family N-acetyltransferase [Acutalibacteraceae bacterium]